MIRRLSDDEARLVTPLEAQHHDASTLHAKLADARRLRALRGELEAELRVRLPPLVRALLAERSVPDAELEPRLEALFAALFGGRTS